jgi:hypothetical protein
MTGRSVAGGLADLARNFPQPRGRYAAEAARTDESGVVFLPPPVSDPLPKVAAAAGLATLAIGAVVALSRRED